MRVLIVDDEALARQRLRRLLGEVAGVEVVAEAAHGAAALDRLREHPADVVLLDIRMPGMDGLETARHLAGWEQAPAVIFTTAFDDHALQAFEAHAIDYLLKPVRQERLASALDRVRRISGAQRAASKPAVRTHLSATLHGNLELIPVADILYLRAGQKYVTVRHCRGEALVEEALKGLEEEFSPRFLRIHRNALVAQEALAGMEGDGAGGWLARIRGSDERLEISRRHWADVRRRLKAL